MKGKIMESNNTNKDISVIRTTEHDWHDAQSFETRTWVVNNRRNSFPKVVFKFIRALKKPKYLYYYLKFGDFYCGDDWNYWWMEKFDYYKTLPKQVDKALEVGCGPYTNIRLISKIIKIKEIHCTDPLMPLYKTFTWTWLSSMVKKNKIKAEVGVCEKIEYPDNFFELVVCNNVLDHVQDAEKCLKEIYRVLKPGGHFLIAQDLTDEEDLKAEEKREGHPIRLYHEFLDNCFAGIYDNVYRKLLTRAESRYPRDFYGTYIYIGKKK